MVRVRDAQDGCVRFSAWSTDSALPRRYESVQVAPGAPIMVSRRYGEWGYAQLHDGADSAILSGNTGGPPSLLTGSHDGSEMGVFCRDAAAIKDRSLLIKLHEYLPIGLSSVLIHLPAAGPRRRIHERQTMATDVARLSFDSGRQYTGVVPQQGRVSLEAEQNEQRVIDAEERRKELLDIVGPAGTPDDGYAVSFVGGALTVGAGTMYVGGLRVELDAPVSYGQQPDWLDGPQVMPEGLRARRAARCARPTSPRSRIRCCTSRHSAGPTARPALGCCSTSTC